MRIIAGKYKGHNLVNFKADHLRPTTDRMKESLFNKLMNHWDQAMVLDLFSGTGNLGLEALSRGARFVTFVEKNPKSLGIIRDNIKKLKIESSSYEILPLDVFLFLESKEKAVYDIVLSDPPHVENLNHELLEAIAKTKIWNVNSILVFESGQREIIKDRYGLLRLFDQRDFGDKKLSFFREESEVLPNADDQSSDV